MLAMLSRNVTRRDPSTFIASFGMWSIICALSLLLPGNVFHQTNVYASMENIYPSDFWWGIAMLLVGVALQVSIFVRSVSFKSTVAAFAAVFWMMVGSLMLFSAASQGFLTIVGAYSVWGAVGCFLAITQWVHHAGD